MCVCVCVLETATERASLSQLQERLGSIAEKQGLRLLKVPANRISFAVDLTPLAKSAEGDEAGEVCVRAYRSALGAILPFHETEVIKRRRPEAARGVRQV